MGRGWGAQQYVNRPWTNDPCLRHAGIRVRASIARAAAVLLLPLSVESLVTRSLFPKKKRKRCQKEPPLSMPVLIAVFAALGVGSSVRNGTRHADHTAEEGGGSPARRAQGRGPGGQEERGRL